jgi:bacteriorhodopsin
MSSNTLEISPTITAAKNLDAASSPTNTTQTIGIQKKSEKVEEKVNPVQYYVKFSFTITYILLLTTGTITLIEALRTPHSHIRHIMNLETCISIVAGYFYSTFVTQIDKFSEQKIPIDWADITKTRYIDWAITTPLMLLTLSLALSANTNVRIKFSTIATVVVLNYLMLYIGYLGETKAIDRALADVMGFVPFTAMFYIIYVAYVKPKYVFVNYVLFGAFVVLWALYGVVYMFNENFKNIAMNILDLSAKCFIGLSLWAYYTQIIYF